MNVVLCLSLHTVFVCVPAAAGWGYPAAVGLWYILYILPMLRLVYERRVVYVFTYSRYPSPTAVRQVYCTYYMSYPCYSSYMNVV